MSEEKSLHDQLIEELRLYYEATLKFEHNFSDRRARKLRKHIKRIKQLAHARYYEVQAQKESKTRISRGNNIQAYNKSRLNRDDDDEE
jgi:hypothetical protein